ncbi:Tryptophan--tRNA ligase, mitochondrial, partial [Fragariocoptes setiger]
MQSLRSRIFSGIQPTGVPHLGNYFGAIKLWLDISKHGQTQDKPIFCIVDLHSLTAPPPPLPPKYDHSNSRLVRENVDLRSYTMLASLLACGLDPKQCVLFRQSYVSEHTQLAWILACDTAMGRLSQLTQYKEKSAQFKLTGIPVGLFTYPLLQAADILLYRANCVPVGEDQAQHIELTRSIARKFNNTYNCDLFREPHVLLNDNKYANRVRSLRDPTKKMSKSDPSSKSRIEIIDEPDVIIENCKKALTDSVSAITYEPESRPAVANLIDIYTLITGKTHALVCQEFASKETSQLKLALADSIIKYFEPVRRKYYEYIKNKSVMDEIFDEGAQQARVVARKTLADVNKLIGLRV